MSSFLLNHFTQLYWKLRDFKTHNSPVEFTRNIDVVHETFNVEGQIGRVGAHQLLQLLTLLIKPHQRSRFGLDIQFVDPGKLLAEVVYQDVIEVFPTEV